MTTAEPGSNQEQSAPAPVPPASRGKRIWQWFWRGSVLADKKRSLHELGARAASLSQRARASASLALNSAELARNADAVGGGASGPLETLSEATASELYRQSCYWALCAIAARSADSAGTSYVDAVWDTLDQQLLNAAAPGKRSEVLRTSLRSGSFVYFAELPLSEQLAISAELQKLAESLIAKVDERARAVQQVLLQRAWRLSLLFLFALLVTAGLVWERETREARSDLAQGAPWRASSKFVTESLNCTSPAQQCAESSNTFFCTNEEKDPWIEFDLGTERQVSAVQVENRLDCCPDRAAPLVVEVSDNHKKWRPVTRQDTEFKSWRGTFAPVKARWVRLRAEKVTYLHLSRVQIFP